MIDTSYTFKIENNLKEDGEYEVVVEKMEVKMLSTGTEKLAIQFRIREDVEQKYQNSCVFEDIWHDKDNPKLFNKRRINMLLGTQEVKEDTVFRNTDAIIEFMLGKKLIIRLAKEFDDYRGEEVNRIKFYRKTKNEGQKIASQDTSFIPTEDDLPF